MSAIEARVASAMPESEIRFMVMPIVFVRPRRIIEQDGRKLSQSFLLRKKGIDFWTLIGGHLEDRERIRTATAREAKEEVGVEINEENLQLRYIAHLKDDIGQRICYFLDVWKWNGEPQNEEPDKVEESGWFDDDNLPMMRNTTKKCIEEIEKLSAEEIGFGEYGWSEEPAV